MLPAPGGTVERLPCLFTTRRARARTPRVPMSAAALGADCWPFSALEATRSRHAVPSREALLFPRPGQLSALAKRESCSSGPWSGPPLRKEREDHAARWTWFLGTGRSVPVGVRPTAQSRTRATPSHEETGGDPRDGFELPPSMDDIVTGRG